MRGETVTIVRRAEAGRDAHGNTTWAETEVAVAGCVVWPTGSTEQIQGQDQTSENLTVWFPPGTEIRPTDRVRARGLLYDVQGVPSRWDSPFTAVKAGVEVRLARVRG